MTVNCDHWDSLAGDESVAVRVDEELGITEHVGFIDGPSCRLAVGTSLPASPVLGGVVVCPSICLDFLRNYRREVVLARALAQVGFVVERFQYRGTGNSDGVSADVTFNTMVDDGRIVAAHLGSVVTGKPVAWIGTRFGALVAAECASPGAPVVLIDPTSEPSRFFREGFRARMAREVRDRQAAPLTSAQLLTELVERGTVDVFGESIGAALYQSTTGLSLPDQFGEQPRPVLVIQLGAGPLRDDLADLVAALRGRGCAVEIEQVGEKQSWWFVNEDVAPSDDVVGPIVAWLPGQLMMPQGGDDKRRRGDS